MKIPLKLPNIFTHFSIPRVDNCCFCVSLRTGSLFFGWFGVVANLLGLFYCTLCMIGVEVIIKADLKKSGEVIDVNDLKKRENLLQLSYLIFAVMCLMDIITNTLFLIGIYKRRAPYIAQWLVSSIIWLMLGVIGQLFNIFANFEVGSYILIRSFVLSFFVFGLRFYWWLSVYSVYDLIKTGKPLEQPWDEIDDHDDEDDEERAINEK